jgi:hypothetical protein
MQLVRWQLYWKSWGFGYEKDKTDDEITLHYVFIGPLQLCFW